MGGAGREQDQRLLKLVRARAAGGPLSKIAERLGISKPGLSTQTNKVMDADLAASGDEDETEIRAAHWPRKGA